MEGMDHPHVVKAFKHADGPNRGQFSLPMEACPGGDLEKEVAECHALGALLKGGRRLPQSSGIITIDPPIPSRLAIAAVSMLRPSESLWMPV